MQLEGTHDYAAPLDDVLAMLRNEKATVAKYESMGHRDVVLLECEGDDTSLKIVTSRMVDVDLPGFAKKVMQPTNTVVQTDEWAPGTADGKRVCNYRVEVQGVPSRIDGTVTLSPEGSGTRQDVVAEVKVSIPLLGGKLEKFAVDNGVRSLEQEAVFTAKELAG